MYDNEYSFHGVAVVELEDSVRLIKPELFKACSEAGGAMAVTGKVAIQIHGVTNEDGYIVALKSFMNTLSREQQDAILHHERAHIVNGDLNKISNTLALQSKTGNIRKELRADKAAAKATSPETMVSALKASTEFRLKTLGLNFKVIKEVVHFFNRFNQTGLRIKAIHALSYK